MSDGNGNKPLISEIDTLPVSAWVWPKPVVWIPFTQHLAFADEVVPRFLEIALQGVPFFHLHSFRTDMARNLAAAALLESDFSHILMLDQDHLHDVNIVQKLCRWVQNDPTKQIVGGLYFRRGEPYEPQAFKQRDDGMYYYLADWEAELVEVDVIGTAALLISRDVFAALPKPWFWYDYSHFNDKASEFISASEDVQFCKAARAAGFRIWCDTTVVMPHLISGKITEATYRSYARMQEAKAEKELIIDEAATIA
jgi:hypothetical protein